jgi:predicted TPR repeat methyltransferase
MQSNWRAILTKTDPSWAHATVTLHAAQLLILGGHRNEAVHAMQELVQRLPNDLQAHEQLGALLKRLGRPVESEAVMKQAAKIEAKKYASAPQDLEGIANFIESSTGSVQAPETAPTVFVTSLFDNYASTFDELLRNSLRYKAPELLLAACQQVLALKSKGTDILDLGCGTGLAGEIFYPFAARLDGVDLSPNMLDLARGKAVYDELHVGEVVEFLNTITRRYPLILAADVFVYIGDLAPVFAAAKLGLTAGGHFAFTVEASGEQDYFLQIVRRYAHSKKYIERIASEHQFTVRYFEETSTRNESLVPVPSYLVILEAT